MSISTSTRIGLAGAAVVGVAFGMARYAYGLTLPSIRSEMGLPEPLLGLIASATFAGYLAGLVLAGPVGTRWGARAPTTVGGVCGAAGATAVALAQTPELLAAGAVLAGSAGGWVWAPYSDIVTRLVPEPQQPRSLAIITTGTSGGLVALGLLAAAARWDSWRLVWVGVACAAVAAGVLNLRSVPSSTARPAPGEGGGAASMARVLRAPGLYSVVYFAVVVVYFTYVSDVIGRSSLPPAAVPAAYGVIGVCGMVGVFTGSLAQRVGSPRVAAWSLCATGAALTLLALAGGSWVAVGASAVVFGVGYMVGSAILAVWAAELVPDQAGRAFTVCLVIGALSSTAAPAVVGAAVPALGLTPLLLVTAGVALVSGAALAARSRTKTHRR